MELTPSKLARYSPLILAFLVLFNFIFKGYFLSYSSIAGDEPFSIFHAQMDVITIIRELSGGNNPPLYEILLHFWIKIFGSSAAAVRLMSLIFSSITVAFLFKLGNKFFNIKVAIYASLLFIFSNYQTYFAHEARVYPFLGMLTVASMYYYLKVIINNDIERSTIIKLILANVLLIYAHYFGFFILIVQFLFIIGNKGLRENYWKKLLLITGVIFLLYLPNTIVFISRFLDSSTGGTWVSPTTNLGQLHGIIHLFSNDSPLVYLTVLIVIWLSAGAYIYMSKLNKVFKGFILLFLFPLFFITGVSIFIGTPYLWMLTQKENYVFFFLFIVFSFTLLVVFNRKNESITLQTKLLVFWFWFPFLFMFIVSLDSFPKTIPMFFDRYLMIISIAFYLFITVSLNAVLKPNNIILPIALLYLFILTTEPNVSNKRNVFQVIERVNELKKDNTLIIMSPKHFDLNFAYYFDYTAFTKSSSIEELTEKLKAKNVVGINDIKTIDLRDWKHIVFLDAGAEFSFPKNDILETLNKDYNQISDHHVYEIFNIYEFEVP